MVRSPRADIDRWNGKYSKSLASRVAVEPRGEPELVQLIRQIGDIDTAGPAIDLASGKGANALFLSEAGYDTLAADFSLNGLLQARRSARAAGLSLGCICCDVASYPFPSNQFNLVCAIRYLDRSVFQAMADMVAPGGYLFYKTFNVRWLESHPGFNPAYVVGENELSESFPDLEVVASQGDLEDSDAGSSFVLARKPLA